MTMREDDGSGADMRKARNSPLQYDKSCYLNSAMSRLSALLLFLGALLHFECVSGFAQTPAFSLARPHRIPRGLSMGASTTESSATGLKDKMGNDVKVGSVVKVAKEGMKAYQVNPKGYGSFVNGKFVQAPEDGDRGSKSLVLPMGMAGVVAKLYDIDDISANLPIQVKFEPGKHNEEDTDPPVAFLMHFKSDEIEISGN